MFGKLFWSSEVGKLNREKDALVAEKIDLQNRVDALQLQIEEINKKAQEEASVASMLIDFSNMDVFSVERNLSNGVAHTIIGYWLENQFGAKSNNEWFLYCSIETHDKIVDAFKKHIAKK